MFRSSLEFNCFTGIPSIWEFEIFCFKISSLLDGVIWSFKKLFLISNDDDEVNSYTLSTAYDTSSKSHVTNFDLSKYSIVKPVFIEWKVMMGPTPQFTLGHGHYRK